MKNVFKTVAIIYAIVGASMGVAAAASANLLIPVALPFAAVLILALRLLGPKPELFAWAALTGWLGSTYLSTGSPVEIAVFFLVLVLAAAGIFKSPYALAVAWLAHPVWDLVPRELPRLMADLPMACLLFDIPIGLYIAWCGWRGHWPRVAAPDNRGAAVGVAKTLFVLLLMLAISYAVVAANSAGWLIALAIPLAMVLIVALRWLGPQGELIGWAAFTGWLWMTYAHGGGGVEIAIFLLALLVCAYGVFQSPWALAAAWVAFIPWNFLPHSMAQAFPQLPMACLLFAAPVAAYLLWGCRRNRWQAFAGKDPRVAIAMQTTN